MSRHSHLRGPTEPRPGEAQLGGREGGGAESGRPGLGRAAPLHAPTGGQGWRGRLREGKGRKGAEAGRPGRGNLAAGDRPTVVGERKAGRGGRFSSSSVKTKSGGANLLHSVRKYRPRIKTKSPERSKA